MNNSAADTHTTLGQVVRAIRQRNGWTLKEMSERSGIPLSTLSKIEHDRLTLTYDKLLQLSQRLNIPLSDLFSVPAQDSAPASGPVTGLRAKGTLDTGMRVETDNYDYFYLCTELRKKSMIPIFTKVRARSVEEFGDLIRHGGEEFIFVLEGRVEVHTEFYDPVVLEKWESFYLDSSMGHAYLAGEGCDEALVIGVCGGDERIDMESLVHIGEKRDATG
ncbi:helix-turn-helix domain-containing protein [Glycocaulis alkaliphilus]|nr:XRE family transcriptional regulator [Glycocaulis alkaliphilus]GGB85082.1 transcriptional regulator [Glycocaulis alkaliphilus]